MAEGLGGEGHKEKWIVIMGRAVEVVANGIWRFLCLFFLILEAGVGV